MLELRCTIQLVFPFPSLACVFSRLINYLNCWFLIEFVHSFSSFCTLCNYEWCNYELRSALEKEAKIFFITYYSCTSPFWCTCPRLKSAHHFVAKRERVRGTEWVHATVVVTLLHSPFFTLIWVFFRRVKWFTTGKLRIWLCRRSVFALHSPVS